MPQRMLVVGAGIVGLATARQLLLERPGLQVTVVDKESTIAAHQSGHNSGVVHAGLYYAPGSLKARLCREGKAALERFCEEREIPLRRCGKLVVATGREELPALAALAARARKNGVPGLVEVGPARIREIEPHATAVAGLYSPTTGIVDYVQVAQAYREEIEARGGEVLLGRQVVAANRSGLAGRPAWTIETTQGPLRADFVITCAGLQSDRVAAMTGDAGHERIVPFRGDYLSLRPRARHLVRALLYPVPDPRFPFLGVHFTRRLDGQVWAGPNAVVAFAREGYGRTDVSLPDLADALGYRGFLRVAAKYWRTGAAEMLRDWWRHGFAEQLRRYVPELRDEDLEPGPSGVRAQSVRIDGALVDDFSIGGGEGILHVRNAPSPAATASLAIAAELTRMAALRFDLH